MGKKSEAPRSAILAVAFCMAFAMSFTSHFYVANAADPPPLQDFCVGVDDPNSAVFVNGKFCKNPNNVTVTDFLYQGFDMPGNTNNTQGAKATLLDITRFQGINTLGVAMARVDFAPYGLNTPHLHPRGSEVFAVMEGTLYAGFVTTDNKLYDTVITKGDMIVFPQGLVHFQLNIGNKEAFCIAAFGSQNPGRIDIADNVFGTSPRILDEVLTQAYQVGEPVIKQLREQFVSSTTDAGGRSFFKLLSQKS